MLKSFCGRRFMRSWKKNNLNFTATLFRPAEREREREIGLVVLKMHCVIQSVHT